MTADIAVRLRARAGDTDSDEADDMREAADEIDGLRARIAGAVAVKRLEGLHPLDPENAWNDALDTVSAVLSGGSDGRA